MFDFFTLKTGIRPHATLDGEDIFKTKSALNQLGYLDNASWAKPGEKISPVNDFASQDMFDATKTFQKDHGLKVDGIIKPDGETATALNKKLAERANDLMGEKTDSATTLEQPKPKGFDFWADQKRKAAPTPVQTTTPWFQAANLPQVDGTVHSANGRAVKTLMNYTDPGEHPRWITEDIKNGVPNAVGTLGNLLVQLSQKDPDKAKTYSDRVLTQLPADKRAEIEKMGQVSTAPKTVFNPDAAAQGEPAPQKPDLRSRVGEMLGLDPNVTQRGTALPLGRTKDGDLTLALPTTAIQAVEALALPGHAAQGGSYTAEDVANMAGSMTGGGLATSQMAKAPQNALGMAVKSTGKVGPFGEQYTADKWKEAVRFLKGAKKGEVTGILNHPDVGAIDVPWGHEGTGKHDGYGLSKLVKHHPAVIDDLPTLLQDMSVTTKSPNRVNLRSDRHHATARLEWNGQKKKWLLTAYNIDP